MAEELRGYSIAERAAEDYAFNAGLILQTTRNCIDGTKPRDLEFRILQPGSSPESPNIPLAELVFNGATLRSNTKRVKTSETSSIYNEVRGRYFSLSASPSIGEIDLYENAEKAVEQAAMQLKMIVQTTRDYRLKKRIETIEFLLWTPERNEVKIIFDGNKYELDPLSREVAEAEQILAVVQGKYAEQAAFA